MMVTTVSSKMSVRIYQSAQRYISEDSYSHIHHCDDLKSNFNRTGSEIMFSLICSMHRALIRCAKF